jgi:hypothetical protein
VDQNKKSKWSEVAETVRAITYMIVTFYLLGKLLHGSVSVDEVLDVASRLAS